MLSRSLIFGGTNKGRTATADVFIRLLTKDWMTQKLKPGEQKYFHTYKWEDLGDS